MSRRETRDSDSRHHRSRFDRESSPKRVRREKAATERPTSKLDLDSAEHIDRDRKLHSRLQDSLPLEAPVVPDSKIESVSFGKESVKKSNGNHEGAKKYSDNNEAPRSRSHFQHDEIAGQVGRSLRHRETTERERWKDHRSGRITNRSSNNEEPKPKDEKIHVQGADHGGSYKMEPDSKQPSKKRPAFRETKTPVDAGNGDKSATEVVKPRHDDGNERKEERGKPSGERDPHRTKLYSRDRYRGRQGQRVEKWKHDLYDEANTIPSSKNEEDQIAKVEALLSS